VAECTSLLYFVVSVRCRRTESSRSLSHLLMSFLWYRPMERRLLTLIIWISTNGPFLAHAVLNKVTFCHERNIILLLANVNVLTPTRRRRERYVTSCIQLYVVIS